MKRGEQVEANRLSLLQSMKIAIYFCERYETFLSPASNVKQSLNGVWPSSHKLPKEVRDNRNPNVIYDLYLFKDLSDKTSTIRQIINKFKPHINIIPDKQKWEKELLEAFNRTYGDGIHKLIEG